MDKRKKTVLVNLAPPLPTPNQFKKVLCFFPCLSSLYICVCKGIRKKIGIFLVARPLRPYPPLDTIFLVLRKPKTDFDKNKNPQNFLD